MLLLEPAIMLIALVAYEANPGLVALVLLDGGRRTIHYALMKPAKESIYAQLDGDTKYRVNRSNPSLLQRPKR